MPRPPLTLGRFCCRFWLVTRSTFVHTVCDGYIDDLPDGSMLARDVGRDGIEVVEAHPWVGDALAWLVVLALVGLMVAMLATIGSHQRLATSSDPENPEHTGAVGACSRSATEAT